jgi:hypothetical protein
VQQAAQNAIVAQTNWLQAERLEPVNLSDTSEGHNALKPEQRTAIQTQVATRLSAIKLISHTKEAYTRALCHILNRQHSLFAEGENEHTHSELHSAVWIDFHIDFLYKTELRGIYPNFYTDHTGNATYQLTRADVHHYTLDLVESELSRHQASCNLELGRERCPESYISQIITTSSYTRQTSVASDKLDELNNTIKQIHHHPELELKARQVYEELHHLHRVARSAELDGIIDLTITLLKPRCIQNPEENLANYMVAAESYSTEHHPSRNWKKLGLAMAILGGVIAALGGGLLLASIIPTTAASILITGGIVAGLTGVSSFFHHRSRIETIEKFAEHVQNAYQY